MFKVVCIKDTDRPDGIPTSKWIKKDTVYTVIEVGKMRMQGGLLGFKLAEVNIDDCFPYQFFSSTRFRPIIPEDDSWAEETLKRIMREVKEEELEHEKVQ